MHKLLIIGALFLVSSVNGQIEEVRRITETLCSPEFHGRGYVNKGDSIAAEFLAAEFEGIGVKPYGKTYFQPFTIDVNTFPGKMRIANNGRVLTAGKDFVINPSSQGTDNIKLLAKEIPKDMAFDIPYIQAAIQEVISGETQENALLFDYTNVSKDTLKELRGLAAEVARIVPVIELIDTKFTWSVGREQRYKLYIQIQDSVFERGAYTDVEIEAKLIPNYETQNVIAYIPSKKKCAKTVVFTAHYDHLGRMGVDTYFPGANDNASGTAMLLTMANHFKKNPAAYNIMFIAFSGEEAGLVGSKHFVDNPFLKLDKIKFLINLDIMGSGEEGITVVNATLFEEQFNLLVEINDENKLLEKVKKRGPAANSDHYWFTENGVPSFFIYTMGPNKHYHDVFDEYSELSFNEYDDITELLIEFVERLKK